MSHQQSILATSYVAGSAVTVEFSVPGSQQKGCKAILDIQVSRAGKRLRSIEISNSDPKFPADGRFDILTASEATSAGALLRVTVLLQKMISPTFDFQITGRQQDRSLFDNKFEGSFSVGRIETFDLDIVLI